MEKLEFSTNWNNKLDCKCFTTIRIYNPQKHFKDNQFEVFLQRKYKGKVVVLGVVKTYLDKLNDYVCYLDTGYNKAETVELLRKMYKAKNIDFSKKQITILLLQKVEPVKPRQETLFN
ncbi:hypothetical protein ACNQF7_03770 [Flavobacterium sp. RSP29]|uniref:hypothetical protein n=1 Tax=Flavobacterium sp. RSP29 TaxID=3401731 RepID=UPI003AAB280B